jgi:glycosyltransferase involved in cell wall biosynthesis
VHLLCVAPYVPTEANTHAGAAYLARYLERVAQTEEVTLIAPATTENVAAAESASTTYPVHVIPPARPRWGRAEVRLRNAALALSPGWPVLRGMADSPEVRRLAAASDVIDIEFDQLLPLAPTLRRAAPGVPIVCTEHDVIAQSFARRARHAPLPTRTLLNVQRRRVAARESALLNQCDLVRVTSEKDAELLRNMGVVTELMMTDMAGGGPPDEAVTLGREGPVVFTGALWRSENEASVLWFVNEVWPRVRKDVGNAEFLAVGANPGPRLLELNSLPGVTVTGWVPELAAVYRDAGVFVAPLVLGAGVKLKVIEAMRYGLPVVATEIGAEGVVESAPPGTLAGVEDDANGFAAAVVALLNDQDRRIDVGRAAASWVAGRPSFEATVDEAVAAYRQLAAARHSP